MTSDNIEVTHLKRIDAICDQFEATWRGAGQGDKARPNIEAFLSTGGDSPQSVLMSALIRIDIHWRRKNSEEPTPDDYLKRFPDHEPAIKRLFEDVMPEADNGNLKIGQTLWHYRVIEKIGQGGMGSVYLAEDQKLRRRVALKVLPPEMVIVPGHLKRFQQEARTAAALGHPNIVTLHSVEEADGLHFITMELVRGQRLTELLSKDGLPVERLFELAVPLTNGVAAAHNHGIVHRDLKPDNVMIDEDGCLKVLDFGLAKIDRHAGGSEDSSMITADETVTAAGAILGTVGYMSPEQAQGKPVDTRSDVFSLGILLYEMATGHRPFTGDNYLQILTSILHDIPHSIRDVNTSLPKALDDIVRRCLSKDAKDRFADASQLCERLDQLHRQIAPYGTTIPVSVSAASRIVRRRWLWTAVVIALVATALSVVWGMHRLERIKWARTEAIPQVRELAKNGNKTYFKLWGLHAWEAHALSTSASRYIGKDPLFVDVWDSVTQYVTFQSDPPGATVWAKPYVDPNSPWRLVGRTPVGPARFPLGLSRIKLELPGHRAEHQLFVGGRDKVIEFKLIRSGTIPEEMVFVPGGQAELGLAGAARGQIESLNTGDFLMDWHEVTNREYKRFMNDGGYETREYWVEAIVRDGKTLSWETAIALFKDATNRTGPATWEVGDFPNGHENHPVTGVSWYEAAAYANWAGKSLPTVFHWSRVAATSVAGEIIPLANFRGNGTEPVDSRQAMHGYGVFDLAGNAREWIKNAMTRDDDDGRLILGGGWKDHRYAFTDSNAQSAWDRSETNGFRCIRYLAGEGDRTALSRHIELPWRDFYRETPVSGETFAIWLRQYDYDRVPLEATINAEQVRAEWVRQTVSFNAAYAGERVRAHIYLPRNRTKPTSTVIYFPGASAVRWESSDELLEEDVFSFIVKSGRALVYPIYKGTFERGDELSSPFPADTNLYKDHVIMWAKDLARSIDYLESREDLDTSNLAFFGLSWGGAMGAVLPAIEKRITANVLYIAGFFFPKTLPEVDPINYVSHVTQPTLMVNGEFDFVFPLENSQKPMYDLLGTPAEHKRHVVCAGAHDVPRSELIKEVLDWLDRYCPPDG